MSGINLGFRIEWDARAEMHVVVREPDPDGRVRSRPAMTEEAAMWALVQAAAKNPPPHRYLRTEAGYLHPPGEDCPGCEWEKALAAFRAAKEEQ